MVAQKKIFVVDNLVQKIKDAKAFFLADYRGLKVSQMTQLRNEIKKTGAQLEVVKNRLFQLAMKKSTKKLHQPDEKMTGPSIILWSYEDEISPLKALIKFSQNQGLPEVKMGWLGMDFLSQEKVRELTQILPKNQLEAKLTGLLSKPISDLTGALTWNINRLSLVIKNLADKKQTAAKS